MFPALQHWPQSVPGTPESHGKHPLGGRGYPQEQVTATAKEEGGPVYVAGTRLGWFCKSVACEGRPSTSCQPASEHAVPSGGCFLH